MGAPTIQLRRFECTGRDCCPKRPLVPFSPKKTPPQASEQEDSGRTRGRSRIATQENVPIATWNSICKAVKISRTDVSLSNGCSDGDVLTAAWAVAIAFVGRPDDVVFGRDVNGQQALTNNIAHGDRIVGTVMNILPVRVELPLHHNMADRATGFGTGRQPIYETFCLQSRLKIHDLPLTSRRIWTRLRPNSWPRACGSKSPT